ncbi:zinc finger protein 16-like [Nerophis ophidion]|uniref:zinc finger protein 16-like n=1 Tax=Nerophis ophidion TaxID=159077 RepID=UPI002AE04287|nr:zinc finger protein 16-like [Nerophis ophidion]
MCERMIAEYEEELCPTKEEKERQQKHQVVLHRTDIHQLIGHQEECLPHLQGDSLTLKDPKPSHFKGEKEDPQTPYFKEEEEGECPVGQEEADLSKFPLTVVSVKTEEHEDKPPESSQLHHSPNVQHPPHIKEEEDDQQFPHIKEEEEEVWITQEEECLLGQEEADLSKFPLTVVSVKTEEHEDKPPESSQLHHSPNVCEEQLLPEKQECSFRMVKEDPSTKKTRCHGPSGVSCEGDEVKGESEEKREAEPPSSSSTQHMTTEADGDHCGGSQADKLLAPLSNSEDTMSHSPDTDDEDSKDDKTCHTDKTHFTCSLCDKTFQYHSYLKRHMRRHTGEKPFSCSVCGKGFVLSHNLKLHLRTHTGEKPFICSICGKGFTHSQSLKKHTMSHTGEKYFICLICSKRFVQSNNLKVHMRTHSDEKPFSCSTCGKAFKESQILKRHKRTHTGEKSHSCSICNRSFCERSNLVRHMRTHPGEKVLSCSVCGERFSYKYQCKKHKCAGENSSSK